MLDPDDRVGRHQEGNMCSQRCEQVWGACVEELIVVVERTWHGARARATAAAPWLKLSTEHEEGRDRPWRIEVPRWPGGWGASLMLRKALLMIIECTLNATTMMKHRDEAWWTTHTILVHVVCSACWWLAELAIIEGYKLSTSASDVTEADEFFFELKVCELCLKIKLTRRKLYDRN